LEDHWRNVEALREPSLAWSLNDTFGWHFWAGGLFKVRFLLAKLSSLLLHSIDIHNQLGFWRHIANDVPVGRESYHSFRTK